MPRRRSFLERLADRALEAASRTLRAANETLDDLIGVPEPEPPPKQPPRAPPEAPRVSREAPSRRPWLTRRSALQRQIDELRDLVSTQAREIETLRAQQSPPPRQPRPPREPRPEPGPRYPKRILGRLGRRHWTEENRRLRVVLGTSRRGGEQWTEELVKTTYYRYVAEGLNPNIMAVVQRSRKEFEFYVGY